MGFAVYRWQKDPVYTIAKGSFEHGIAVGVKI
jgi:hypothetical protein